MPHRLARHSSIMFSATIVANLLAYLFHVYMGRSLGAAEYGILGSLLAAFYILFVPLGAFSTVVTKFVSEFKARKEYGKVASLLFPGMRKLSRYAILIFIGLSLGSWLTADFLRIPSPFPVEEAGIYTVVSVLGKVIFFVSGAFTIPMFPLVSELHTRGENTLLILKKSLFYVISFSGLVIAAYWLFPSFIVHTLYGRAYSLAIPLLGAMGIAMGLIALVMVYTTYLLALKDTRFVKVLLGCTFLQIILLSLFHHTLLEVIYVLILTNGLTLFLLLLSRLKTRGRLMKTVSI